MKMNKLAWSMMIVLFALVLLSSVLGYTAILMTLMGPQIIAITLTACAYAIMSLVGVVD